MSLDDLRNHFWWLGPGKHGSYIIALDGTNVTVKVIQASWTRRTMPYEEAVARDFAALGFSVTWVPFWREDLQAEMDEVREAARKKGQPFDETTFVEAKRRGERK
jgi:hypothetical protein